MKPEISDADLLVALRRMWEAGDPPPADLDALALASVDRAERDGDSELNEDLIVLRLLSEELAFDNVRSAETSEPAAQSGERALRFADRGYEVLLRIAREPGGFRVDGWSTPATEGIVRMDVDGRVHHAVADAYGRFAFVEIDSGRASLSLTPESADSAVWTTARFSL